MMSNTAQLENPGNKQSEVVFNKNLFHFQQDGAGGSFSLYAVKTCQERMYPGKWIDVQ